MDRIWTDEEIATWAAGLRRFAGQPATQKLEILGVIDKLAACDDPKLRIDFTEVPDERLPKSDAEVEPKARKIRYRQTLMLNILAGDPSATEIMLEEIGHVFLHGDMRTLNHFQAVDFRARNIRTVERKEREAYEFALHALAPIEETYAVDNPATLQMFYGLSEKSSLYFCDHLRRTRAKIERKPRVLPSYGNSNILSFKDAAQQKNYPLRLQVAPETIPQPKPDKIVRVDPARPAPSSPEQTAAREMGFGPIKCRECGNLTVRSQSGCDVCETCGESEGCD